MHEFVINELMLCIGDNINGQHSRARARASLEQDENEKFQVHARHYGFDRPQKNSIL